MRRESPRFGLLRGGVERIAARVTVPKGPTSRGREHERVSRSPSQVRRQFVDQEPRKRYRTRLVRLRRAPLDAPAIDLDHRLGDTKAPTHEVHAADTQSSQFRAPQAAISEHQDGEAVL